MVDGQNPVPFILGDLPYEPKNEVFILLSKAVPDEEAIAKLEGTLILRGFQGVVAG